MSRLPMINKMSEIHPKFLLNLYVQEISNNDTLDMKILHKTILKMYHRSAIRTQLSEADGLRFISGIKFNAFKDSSKYKIVNNPDGTTDLLIKNIQYFKGRIS